MPSLLTFFTHRPTVVAVVSAACASVACAQSAEVPATPPATTAAASAPRLPDPDAPKPWTVQIEPMIWFAAPSGKVQLPINSGNGPGSVTTAGDKVQMSTLDLDSARLRPAGELHINADDWRFSFAGSQFENSGDSTIAPSAFRLGAVNVAAGDAFRMDFDLGAYELSVGYKVYGCDFCAESAVQSDAVPIVLKVYALAGARLYDVNFDFERLGGAVPQTAGYNDLFVEPLLGGRGELEITQNFGIDLQLTAGYLPGDQSTFSIDVSAGFHWRPIENLGVQIGYRQLAFDLEDGDGPEKFRYDGRLAGLFAGVVLRF